MTPRIWLIAGPTASGKSALALALAQKLGADIIGADALQLYADLPILSAAPSPNERAQAPHHLVGVADAADGWSVGRWHGAARALLDNDRPCVVVGGTGLYFRALTQGLAATPPLPHGVRTQVEAEYDALGEQAFRARLAAVDPAAEARIMPRDRQRLSRAWEVWAGTGRSLTDWQSDNTGALPAGSWRGVVLEPPRDPLYARCDARFENMVLAGALQEVATLAARDLPPSLPAMKAVGYRELAAHLRGELTLEAAMDAARMETRRYAKRQTTWARGQMADWPRITDLDPNAQLKALNLLIG